MPSSIFSLDYNTEIQERKQALIEALDFHPIELDTFLAKAIGALDIYDEESGVLTLKRVLVD